jgi:K+/H+ antiporter YhaU regulatory subunit KhtT
MIHLSRLDCSRSITGLCSTDEHARTVARILRHQTGERAMRKIRLNLEPLEVESFAVAETAAEEQGTVAAHEAGPTRNCATPNCTVGTECI